MDNINGTYVENNILPQLYRLKNVHYLVEQVLKPLAGKAVRGIQCTIKEQKIVGMHLVLRSYSVYIPERKDMFGLKH